jgi:RNA polymerase sigma-70 factor (ECF subfamily)
MAQKILDEELVRQAQQGDKSAYDMLVRKYHRKVLHLIHRFVKNPDDALDVAQDAFIKAYRALPGFRGDSVFYTWLYRIAVNTSKNHLASRARHPSEETIDTEEAEFFESAAGLKDHDTPEGLVMSDELAHVIQSRIERLPVELRTALSLREFDGHSYDEIAEIMRCPVGTIRSRIFRARECLDKELEYLHQ